MDVESDKWPSMGAVLNSFWPLAGGALTGIVLRLIYSGTPGHAYESMRGSFVLLAPTAVGAVAVFLAERERRRSWGRYFAIGASANVMFVLGTFFALIEGLICVIVALPLFCLLGGIGGLLMGAICRWTRWRTPATYSFVLLPLLLGGVGPQPAADPPLSSVTREFVVPASPAAIWPHLLVADHIRPGELDGAWIYRIGVPLPLSAVTQTSAEGSVRHIRMGKGVHFDQVVQDFRPNERVHWNYRFESDSFPAGALDDHVRIGGAYFDLLDAEYTLREVSEGTALRVTMHYRVNTGFNWYARPLARLLIGNFEDATLQFFAARALERS